MHLFPPIAGSLREARLLGFMPPPEGPGSTPAPSQDDVERDVAERAQRESQEQDPFANDNPAAAPEASRNARRRTEIQLSTADRQTVDRLKREASALSTMIEKLEQRLRAASQSQRDNVRGAMAILPRFGGGMGPIGAQRRLGAMSDWQMMQSLQTEINKLKGERETMYREIDRIQARGRAGLSRDTAPATETSAPASTQDRFSPNAPDGTRFDLENRLSDLGLDQQSIDMFRGLKPRILEKIAEYLESLSPQEQQILKSGARKLLPIIGNSDTRRAFISIFEENKTLSFSEDQLRLISEASPTGASVADALQTLTPDERASMERFMGFILQMADTMLGIPAANQGMEQAEVDQAQVDKYVTRWKEAKTEADRMIAEGMLLLNGVDTDASDLEKDQLVFLNEDTRIGGLIAGIFKLVQGMIEKFGGKSARIEAGNQPANEPALASLTPEQQDEKKTALEQTIEATEEKIETAETDLKKLETQRDAAEGTEREEIQGRIDRLKKDIKALTELLAQAQETLAELQRLIDERNRGPKAEAGRPGEPTSPSEPAPESEPEDSGDEPPSGFFSIPPQSAPPPPQPETSPTPPSEPDETSGPEGPTGPEGTNGSEANESPEGAEISEEQVEALTVEADRLDQIRATAEAAVDGTPATIKAAIDAITAELEFIDANPGLVALELISAQEVTELRQRGQELVDQYNVLVEKGGTSLEASREEVVTKLRELSADAQSRGQMVVSRERSFAAGLEEDRKGSGWFGSLTRTLTLSDPWKIEIDQALQKASSMEFALDMNMKIINEELAKDPKEVDITKVVNAIESIQRTIANINKVDTDDEHWRIHDQAIAVTRDVSIAVITLPAAFIGGPATASVGAAMKFGAVTGARVAFLQSATRNTDEVLAGNKSAGEAFVDTGVDTATGAATGALMGGLFRAGGNVLSRLRLRKPNAPPPQSPNPQPQPGATPKSAPSGGPQPSQAPPPGPNAGPQGAPPPPPPGPNAGPQGAPPPPPPGPNAGPRPGPQAGAKPGPQAGPQSAPPPPPPGPNAGPKPGPQAGPKPGPQSAPPPPGPNAGPKPGPQAGPRSGPQAGPRPGPHAGPKPGPQAKPQGGPRPGPNAGPRTGPKTGPQAGPRSGPQAGPRPGPNAGPKPGPQAKPQGGPKPKTNPTPDEAPTPGAAPRNGPSVTSSKGFDYTSTPASDSMLIREFLDIADDVTGTGLKKAAVSLMSKLHPDRLGQSGGTTAASETNVRIASRLLDGFKRNPDAVIPPRATLADLKRLLSV